MSITRDGAACLQPELDYRLRYVVQEGWQLARLSRRTVLLAEDITLAHALLQGSLHSLPWAPLPDLDAFGLTETVVMARPVQTAGEGARGVRARPACLHTRRTCMRTSPFTLSAHSQHACTPTARAPSPPPPSPRHDEP